MAQMMKFPLAVEMDGGVSHKVVADQRDWARLEVSELPDTALVARVRYLAWSAMTRMQLTTATWPDFNERLCIEASSTASEEAEGEQGLDPGRATRRGSSTSRSRGAQAKP